MAAMPHVKVYADLAEHPKSLRLAGLLNQPMAWAHVLKLWMWASRHAVDGNLAPIPDADIASLAGWTRDASLFVDALVAVGFMDGRQLHDYEERQNPTKRKASATKALPAPAITVDDLLGQPYKGSEKRKLPWKTPAGIHEWLFKSYPSAVASYERDRRSNRGSMTKEGWMAPATEDLHGNRIHLPTGYVWDARDAGQHAQGRWWTGEGWSSTAPKGLAR